MSDVFLDQVRGKQLPEMTRDYLLAAERLADYRRALQSITDAIDEAVNTKIRTGRMPKIGALLSEIQDTANSALAE